MSTVNVFQSNNELGRADAGSAFPTEVAVAVNSSQSHLTIDRERLVALVRTVLADQTNPIREYSISIAIVDDATIHALNRTHLNHDWPTDVITFVLDDGEQTGVVEAELIVSAEMAVETAREGGVDPWHEFALYVVHGLLHVCGYDDTTENTRLRMREREGVVLDRLGLSNTFDAVPFTASVTVGPAPLSESERCAL